MKDDWPRRVMANSNVKDGTRLVLIALAEHANKEGQCNPSVYTLSRLTMLKERQVQRHLRKLCEAEEIRIVTPGGGRNRPTVYEITVSLETPFHEAKRCHQIPGFSPAFSRMLQQSKRVSQL